jgi:hypothetical protein
VTPDEFSKVQEISRLLREAYDHYFEYEGHCKSSEGQIDISYGNLWEREDPNELKVESIYIYSYVFCRGERSKTWDTIDEALEEVRGWHAEEMAYDYNSPEALENQRLMSEMAAEFLDEMMDSGRLTIIQVDLEDEGDIHGFPV